MTYLQPPLRMSRIEVRRFLVGPPTSPGGTGCLIEAVSPLSLGISKPSASTVTAGLGAREGAGAWATVQSGVDNTAFVKMTYRIPAVQASQYVRLRGTNLPAGVPYETDANGNPLADLYTNANDTSKLRIPCTTVGTNVPATGTTYTGTGIDGCPAHLPVVGGKKMVAYDVAAWSDLWFYSNPIYVEVQGSTTVAGLK